MSEQVGAIHYDVELNTAQMVRGQREVDSAVSRAAGSFNAITSAVKLYAAAMALVKVVQFADDLRMLAARIDVAAGSAERGAEAMREINAISIRTQTSVQANAEVFTRLNQSLLQMGGTQRDTLNMTELLGKAIKVSGASAVEAKSAMLQFGQALGSGKLSGDELRSLLENAPYLMRQLADGIGVPIGALKKLGEDGKLTADVVVNALSKAAAKIDQDFQKLPQTFASAMESASDGAKRANEATDTLLGTSAAMTGVAKGAGDSFGMLADRLLGVTTEADKLGRNKTVEEWANGTRLALSYLADAADVVWQTISVMGRNVAFVVTGIGTEIGGIGAQAVALARGDLAQARAIGEEMKADAKRRREELDAADAKALNRPLAGQAMRQRMEALANGTDGSDRLDRMARGGSATKLNPPSAGGDKKKDKFDELAYLSGLAEKAADEREKVTIIEEEALRKADELRKAGKISAEQYATARTLIVAAAARSREEIEDKANKRIEDLARDANERIIQDEKKTAEEKRRMQDAAQDILNANDPVRKLRYELEQKSALLAEYAQKDQENALLYAAAKVRLEADTAEKIKEIEDKRRADQMSAQMLLLQGYGGLFGSMADMAKTFGGEQSRTYKALFAVSKAFAIAESIIKIQQGIAAASSLPFPANIPAMAQVASMTAGIIATIKGVQFGGGRQYGGPASAGALYRVNEGGRPEMFTAANGAQYMMPTADGRVTPAGGAGGAVKWTIVVNNGAAGATASASVDDQSRTVTIAIAQVADQIRQNSGPVWSALRSASNVAPRIS